MKRILLAFALLLIPTLASAQCSGVFGANTVCGTTTSAPPKAIPFINFPIPGQSTATVGQVLAFPGSGGAAVPLTLVTSVKAFGAVCDGSTDDTTALTAAAVAAQAGNMTLFIPANSTCIVNSANALNFTTGNVVIQGAGPTSVIKAEDSAALTGLITSTGTNTLQLFHIVLDGNRANTGFRNTGNATALFLQTSHFKASYVEFRNSNQYGVQMFSTPTDMEFDHCWFHDIGMNVVALSDIGVGIFGGNGSAPGPDDVSITNSVFQDIHATVSPLGDSAAINLAATGVRIVGNIFKNNYNINGGQLAFTDGSTGATVLGITIQDNVLVQTGPFESDLTAGIEINGSDVVVSGNVIAGAGAAGIRVEGSSNNILVSGNMIDGFGVNASDAAVELQGTPTKVSIKGNQILNGPIGISVAASGNIVAEGNYIDSTVTTPFSGIANLSPYKFNSIALAIANATSGSVTLQTVTGALGTVTASLPANTGTIAELNLTQAWTGLQSFASIGPVTLGWSSTVPTIASGFCSSGSPVTTVDASNGTAAFDILIGAATCGSTGTLTMPAATTGWACSAADVTTPATHNIQQTGTQGSTTAVVLTDYARVAETAQNFNPADHIHVTCTGY